MQQSNVIKYSDKLELNKIDDYVKDVIKEGSYFYSVNGKNSKYLLKKAKTLRTALKQAGVFFNLNTMSIDLFQYENGTFNHIRHSIKRSSDCNGLISAVWKLV